MCTEINLKTWHPWISPHLPKTNLIQSSPPKGVRRIVNLGPWEMSCDCERQRDGRIHVGTGNVAHGVDHDGDNQAESKRYAHRRHFAMADFVHHSRSTAREHQNEGADHFRYQLLSKHFQHRQ